METHHGKGQILVVSKNEQIKNTTIYISNEIKVHKWQPLLNCHWKNTFAIWGFEPGSRVQN